MIHILFIICLLAFNNTLIIQWLNDGPATRGFYTYTYPIAFNKIFMGVHGYCSSFTGTPSLEAISFRSLLTTTCIMYSDKNKPYNYAILIGN